LGQNVEHDEGTIAVLFGLERMFHQAGEVKLEHFSDWNHLLQKEQK